MKVALRKLDDFSEVEQIQLAEQHPTGTRVFCKIWLCPLILGEP